MKAKSILAILLFAVSLFLVQCKKDKGPVEDDNNNESVSFSNDVQPIFTQNCVSCHPSSGNLDLRQGQAYDNLVNVPASGYNGTRVVPNEPENSILYKKIDGSGAYGSNMPLGGSLSQSQVNTIKQWIEEGAPNN